jgi:sugar lactone lactonase YvrE
MRRENRRRRFIGAMVGCAAASVALAPLCAAREYLVADQAGNRIVAFDAVTGVYKRTIWSTTEPVQPAAMSFGPGGDLYFASRRGGSVLRIARGDLGGSMVTATPFLTNLYFPGALAYHPGSNTLLVGEFGQYPGGPLGDEVFAYDGNGVRQATMTVGEVGIAGLAVDAAGDIYASGFFTNQAAAGRIYKFSGPPSWQSQGPYAPSDLEYPFAELQGAAGIAFDEAGDLLVSGLITFNTGDVVRFSVEGGQIVGHRVGDYIPFPAGLLLAEPGQLLVMSLGFGPSSGTVYRFNTKTGARSVLLAGDFDLIPNGVVDAVDLSIWRSSFEVDASADADFDGDSDGNDFLAWQRGLGNHGAPGPFSPSSVVAYDLPAADLAPEPSSAAIGLLALAALNAARRRGSLARQVCKHS